MKPIYSVKDRAIEGFGDPFVQPSEQHALRWFRDIVNDDPTKSSIAKHPDDYDLYQVGEYDLNTGRIKPFDIPNLIARAKDLLNGEQQ